MSMSRSSRAAAGLFRLLAVTPGARLGAASPAAWSQVRARVRSFKRATRSDDDAVPTQNALPRPHPQVAPLATVAHRAANVGVRAVVNPGFAAGAVRTIAVEALRPLDR